MKVKNRAGRRWKIKINRPINLIKGRLSKREVPKDQFLFIEGFQKRMNHIKEEIS